MNPLHSLKYSRDKKGKSELSLKATDMQEAAVKTLTCLMIWNQSEILLWNISFRKRESFPKTTHIGKHEQRCSYGPVNALPHLREVSS